jgi:hypothetical protein
MGIEDRAENRTTRPAPRAICWAPIWRRGREGVGLEHLILSERVAESTVLAFDEADRAFCLTYRLAWDAAWRLQTARLEVRTEAGPRSLALDTDGEGHWRDGEGRDRPELEGCLDIDIWPTPFTNTFPIRRAPLAAGERRAFVMAWVSAPALSVRPMRQGYTRLAERLYRYENLEGSEFRAELSVDADGVVLDYEGVFRRIR